MVLYIVMIILVVLMCLLFSKNPELDSGLGEGIFSKQRLIKHQLLHQESVPVDFSRSSEARGFT